MLSLSALENWVNKYGFSNDAVNPVVDEVVNSRNAMLFSNTPLSNLKLYVVMRHAGVSGVVKHLKGSIVRDMLDLSYLYSRDLVCIPDWDFNKSCVLSFNADNDLCLEELSVKELKFSLFSLSEQSSLKYVAMTGGIHPATLNMDMLVYKGVDYNTLKSLAYKSYQRSLSLSGVEVVLDSPKYYLVDFN